jgi:hypothetical protein
MLDVGCQRHDIPAGIFTNAVCGGEGAGRCTSRLRDNSTVADATADMSRVFRALKDTAKVI